MRRAVDYQNCQAKQCREEKPSERYVEHLEVGLIKRRGRQKSDAQRRKSEGRVDHIRW